MKILIIGSKGFIGSHAYRYFKQKFPETYAADVVTDYVDTKYFLLDSTNSDFSEIFMKQEFDFCINCSGAASVPDSLQNTLRDFNLNAHNVLKIADSIKKYNPKCKLINLSSAAIYGNPKSLPIKESDLPFPVSPYGYHKKFAEDILTEFYNLFKVECCSIRIFSAYGEGLQKQILWDIFKKTQNQKEITLFGTGKETRDFIHVSDIIQSIDLIMKTGSFCADIYNVANGEQISIKTIAETLLKELNFTRSLHFSGEERAGDPLYWVADISKITALGYAPKIDIQTGIKNYASWVKNLI